jgi:hypothetical protein
MITEVNEENGFVVVDTNHPLAGMTLEFGGGRTRCPGDSGMRRQGIGTTKE